MYEANFDTTDLMENIQIYCDLIKIRMSRIIQNGVTEKHDTFTSLSSDESDMYDL